MTSYVAHFKICILVLSTNKFFRQIMEFTTMMSSGQSVTMNETKEVLKKQEILSTERDG